MKEKSYAYIRVKLNAYIESEIKKKTLCRFFLQALRRQWDASEHTKFHLNVLLSFLLIMKKCFVIILRFVTQPFADIGQ